MAVVREFTLPDLGEGLTEAEIVRWLVEVGEVVAIDQPVVEVETAKAMVEVPCPYGGVVTARFGEEGTEVPVGGPLVTVAVGAVPDDLAGAGPGGAGLRDARQGGAPGGAAATPASATASGASAEDAADSGSGNVLVGYGTGAAAARRRRIRPRAERAPWRSTAAPGGGTDGRPRPVPAGDRRWPVTRRRGARGTAQAEAARYHRGEPGPPEPGRSMPTAVRWPSSRRWCAGWRGNTAWICGS